MSTLEIHEVLPHSPGTSLQRDSTLHPSPFTSGTTHFRSPFGRIGSPCWTGQNLIHVNKSFFFGLVWWNRYHVLLRGAWLAKLPKGINRTPGYTFHYLLLSQSGKIFPWISCWAYLRLSEEWTPSWWLWTDIPRWLNFFLARRLLMQV